MGTLTQRTGHRVTEHWTDVTTSIPGATVAGMLRNQSGQAVEVIKGGTEPSLVDSGISMPAYGREYCDTAHIWVRTNGRTAAVVAFEILN